MDNLASSNLDLVHAREILTVRKIQPPFPNVSIYSNLEMGVCVFICVQDSVVCTTINTRSIPVNVLRETPGANPSLHN